MTTSPKLVLVGGFLGAGKTTLIVRAANLLRSKGVSVAVITNDQDKGLVDTYFTESHQIRTGEVTGGCFCCHFSDLLKAANALKQHEPELIFAEPVGSCVDLSATILQPLKAHYRFDYTVAPLTVLVDPEMASRVFAGEVDENVGYLFRKQLEEADILCLTKTDKVGTVPELPVPVDFHLSAVTGQGLPEWLSEVKAGSRRVGARLLDVDYSRYAEAEAALGWINLRLEIELKRALSPTDLVLPVIQQIDQRLSARDIRIAHLKISDRCHGGLIKVSVCSNGDKPQSDGDLSTLPQLNHEMAVNLRALGMPEELQAIVQQTIGRIEGEVSTKHSAAFRPAPPKPEHRFSSITP